MLLLFIIQTGFEHFLRLKLLRPSYHYIVNFVSQLFPILKLLVPQEQILTIFSMLVDEPPTG